MPNPANTVIGHIVDVQGDLLVATLVEDDQGHTPTVTIGDEDILVGQLGSYVAVKQNEIHLIAIVTRMTEQEALASPTIETPGDDPARANRSTHARRVDYRGWPIRAWRDSVSDDGSRGPCDWLSRHRKDV